MSHCIFRESWWVESLAGDSQPGCVVYKHKNGAIIELPYVLERKAGFTYITMPPLTQTAGPLIHDIPHDLNDTTSISHSMNKELISLLPKHDAFYQNFHPSIDDWLPWYWEGFSQMTRYTYRLDDLSNLEMVYSNFKPKIRRDIKKALNKFELAIHSKYDIDEFLDINEMSFQRQGLKLPYKRSVIRELDQICKLKDCRRIFFAEDKHGQIHAAAYIVWDTGSCYYLMGGVDTKLRNSGAISAVLWQAIQFAASINRSFDFEGSMICSIESFVRGFGAKRIPYFGVSKINSNLLQVFKLLKDRK